MHARIQDVAKAAGVSTKTVSRVLNNEPLVKDATRTRVQDAAKALNYRPDRSARSLAGRRSYLVALLYDNPSASYLMEILIGVVEACQAQHYGMVLQPLHFGSPGMLDDIDTLVMDSKLDGLILTPPITDSAEVLERLDQLGIPYSCISPKNRATAIGVGLDEQQACCDMMAHLVSLGHTRIAHIRGDPSQCAAGWRYDGYCDGLRQASLHYDPTLVLDGMFTFESGVIAAEAIFTMANPPTAIFAANDDMAAGVMRVAHERRLAISDDVSVCGFDNSPMSRHIFPALTTVNQPTTEMGHMATVQLLKAVKDRKAGRMIHMAYSLELRQSTGAAPTR